MTAYSALSHSSPTPPPCSPHTLTPNSCHLAPAPTLSPCLIIQAVLLSKWSVSLLTGTVPLCHPAAEPTQSPQLLFHMKLLTYTSHGSPAAPTIFHFLPGLGPLYHLPLHLKQNPCLVLNLLSLKPYLAFCYYDKNTDQKQPEEEKFCLVDMSWSQSIPEGSKGRNWRRGQEGVLLTICSVCQKVSALSLEPLSQLTICPSFDCVWTPRRGASS